MNQPRKQTLFPDQPDLINSEQVPGDLSHSRLAWVTGQRVKQLALGGLVCLGLGSLVGLGGWLLRQSYEQARQQAAQQLERNQVGGALAQYQQAQRNPWNWLSSDPVAGADLAWIQQEVEAIDLELTELEERMAANPNQMADWIALASCYPNGEIGVGQRRLFDGPSQLTRRNRKLILAWDRCWSSGVLQRRLCCIIRSPQSGSVATCFTRRLGVEFGGHRSSRRGHPAARGGD